MKKSTAIVDDIGFVVGKMRDSSSSTPNVPYYLFGHRLEIANTLTEKENSQFKYQRYPLVALRLDIAEQNNKGIIQVKLNMAVMTKTEQNYTAKQRYDNVFKPVLYPLYDSLIEALRTSGIFFWSGNLLVPAHTKLDRPYWGTQFEEGNVKNIFNDPIDAVELIDLTLNKKLNCSY